MTKKITKTQAKQALAAIKAQFGAPAGVEPKIVEDFDWLGDGGTTAIVWEEGPYEWALLAFHGGIEEEFGLTVPAVPKPKGVWAEPITTWALGLYPE